MEKKKTRREKNTEYQQTYRKKHPGRIAKSNQTYYQNHRQEIDKRQKSYRESKAAGNAGDLLKAHRTALGLSQQAYAERLGITQGTLSMWERGVVPVNLETVGKVFPEFADALKKKEK